MMATIENAEWYDRSVEEVAEGIFRVPLPLPGDGLRAVNVYLIIGDGAGPVCIDSGWAVPEARHTFERSLAALNLELGDIDRFLVTHIHRDHYTQAIAVRRELETNVSIGEGERATLDVLCDPNRNVARLRQWNLIRNGAGDLAKRLSRAESLESLPKFEYELPDDWLRDGDVVDVPGRALDVIETPGHTQGHIVFYDAVGSRLFAGDHILSTITPSIGVEASPGDNPLGDFLASLAKIRKLPDAELLPAHGPTRPSTHARIDELVAHHAARLDDTLAAASAGFMTAFDIARQLRWTRYERTIEELDLLNQSLAVTETAAHLRLLEAQGRVYRVNSDIECYFVE